MAISKQKKEAILKDLKDKFSKMKAVVFVDYSGLGVGKLEEMRDELRKEDIDFRVAKKTLLARAMKEGGIESDGAEPLEGQVAVVFGYKDEVMPAKIMHGFTESLESLKILSGILEKKFVDAEQIITLAKLPSRDELLAKTVGSISAPISGLANVLRGNMRGLIHALNAISQKS